MAQKKKRLVFLIVPLALIFSVCVGFGVGHIFLTPQIIKNKNFKLDIGIHGVRLIDPDEKKPEDSDFSDVWQKGVSKKDIPPLRSGSGKRNSSSGADIDNEAQNANDLDVDNSTTPAGNTQSSENNPATTSNEKPTEQPKIDSGAYNENSKKRGE